MSNAIYFIYFFRINYYCSYVIIAVNYRAVFFLHVSRIKIVYTIFEAQ